MGKINKFKGRMRLLFQLSRLNLRITTITLVGLVIALSMIAGCLIYLESNKNEYYLEILKDNKFNRPLTYWRWEDQFQDINSSDVLKLQKTLNGIIVENNLGDFLVPHPFSPYCVSFDTLEFLNQSESRSFFGFNLSNSILNDCLEGSSLPVDSTEIIIFAPNQTSLTINDSINITKKYHPESNPDIYNEYNLSLKISGILNSSTELPEYILKKEFFIFTSLENFLIINKNMELEIATLTGGTQQDYVCQVILEYTHNHTLITEQNIVQYIHNLYSFSNQYSWSIYLNNFEIRGQDTGQFQYLLQSKIEEFYGFFSMFLTFSTPSFILSILLVNFSIGVMNERRKKAITLLKMRGLSSNFILSILITELIIISLLSSTLALLLGIPLSMLMVSTSGYLLFDFSVISTIVITIPSSVFLTVLILSFILTFGSYLRSARLLAKTSIAELQEEISKKKQRKVRGLRGNIDVFLLIQGILGITLLNYFLDIISRSPEDSGITIILIPLILVLAFFSPLLFVIGFIFSFNRLTPIILHKMGNYFWKRDWGLLATATRNLSVNIKATVRTTLLIACTLSFLIILWSLPLSISQNQVDNNYYNIGSDIQISNYNSTAVSDLYPQLHNISGLEATFVDRLRIETSENNQAYRNIWIYGITENFSQIAHWRSFYDSNSLDNLVSRLFSSNKEYPVIIDSHSSSRDRLKTGNDYKFTISNTESTNLSIEGISDYWPLCFNRYSKTDTCIVTTQTALLDIMKKLSIEYYFTSIILGRISSQVEKKVVIEQVQNLCWNNDIYGIKVAGEDLDSGITSRTGMLFWITTNFNLSAALSIIFALIVLFTFIRLTSYATEIGLSRALGMKFRQVFLLMFLEPMLLFLISGLPGVFVGFTLLFGIVFFISNRSLILSGPPFMLVFDLPILFLIITSIFVVTLIAGGLTSFMATRANISKILKAE